MTGRCERHERSMRGPTGHGSSRNQHDRPPAYRSRPDRVSDGNRCDEGAADEV